MSWAVDNGWTSDTPALVVLLVITSGLLLGRVRVAGVSLGSSGVIFVALLAGYLGYGLPHAVGTVGLVLFIYCVGLAAGPTFFRAFRRQGVAMALMAIALVVAGGAAAVGVSLLFGIPRDLAAGLFAGALTSTPGLAAAMEALPAGSRAGVGFGLAYPAGLVGVVLFVNLLPRIWRPVPSERDAAPINGEEDRRIQRALVKVRNPAVIGRKLSDLTFISDSNCEVSRMLVGNRLLPVPADLVLADGQHLLLIAWAFRLPPVIQMLGEQDEVAGIILDTEDQSLLVVVSSSRIVGRSLDELHLRAKFGVTITRILRHEQEFVPRTRDRIQYGDMLKVVGERADLESFAAFAGHRARTFDETDLISLGVGIAAGVLLGRVEIGLGDGHIALGLSGGPLLVALVLAHFGRIGPVKGHLPRASRLLLTEIGLVLLLAQAGMSAGSMIGDVFRLHGPALCVSSVIVTIVPMAVGVLVARQFLRLPLPAVLGGICGGMTSTPGIGVVAAKTDSEAPVVSYAAAYPVALILMTVLVRVIIALVRN